LKLSCTCSQPLPHSTSSASHYHILPLQPATTTFHQQNMCSQPLPHSTNKTRADSHYHIPPTKHVQPATTTFYHCSQPLPHSTNKTRAASHYHILPLQPATTTFDQQNSSPHNNLLLYIILVFYNFSKQRIYIYMLFSVCIPQSYLAASWFYQSCIYQQMHKRVTLKRILKFTLKH